METASTEHTMNERRAQFVKCNRLISTVLRHSDPEVISSLLMANAESYRACGVCYVEYSLSFNSFMKHFNLLRSVCHELEQADKPVVCRFLLAFNRRDNKIKASAAPVY